MGLTNNLGKLSNMITSTGSAVGIGTSTPNSILEIKTSTATNSIRLGVIADDNRFNMISLNGLNTEGNYIGFAGGGSTDTNLFYQSGNGGDHRFRTGNGSSFTERMRITNAGNVGIGTISPGYPLTVNGNIASTNGGIYYLQRSSGSVILPIIRYWNGSGSPMTGGALGDILTMGTQGSNDYVIATDNVERLRIKSIGQNEFKIYSETVFDMLVLNNTAATSAGIRQKFQNGFGDLAAFSISQRDNGSLADDGQMLFQVASNSVLDTKMTILNNGNIGAPSGSNIYNASDKRLKQNIVKIENGLDKVLALNPVKFNWINDFEPSENDKDMLGFIAQEVKDAIPEAVEDFAKNSIKVGDLIIDNPLRVNEKFIIPVLVKAIQELSAKVSALENKS